MIKKLGQKHRRTMAKMKKIRVVEMDRTRLLQGLKKQKEFEEGETQIVDKF